ncbi:hypothetical protein D3C76_1807460 [compost metagenome]
MLHSGASPLPVHKEPEKLVRQMLVPVPVGIEKEYPDNQEIKLNASRRVADNRRSHHHNGQKKTGI